MGCYRVRENQITKTLAFKHLNFVFQKKMTEANAEEFVIENKWTLDGKEGFTLEEVTIVDPKHIYKLFPDNLVFKKIYEDDDEIAWLRLVKPDGSCYDGQWFYIDSLEFDILFRKSTDLPQDSIPGKYTGIATRSHFLDSLHEDQRNFIDDVCHIADKQDEEAKKRFSKAYWGGFADRVINRFKSVYQRLYPNNEEPKGHKRIRDKDETIVYMDDIRDQL